MKKLIGNVYAYNWPIAELCFDWYNQDEGKSLNLLKS
jgi:hypothetical protein